MVYTVASTVLWLMTCARSASSFSGSAAASILSQRRSRALSTVFTLPARAFNACISAAQVSRSERA